MSSTNSTSERRAASTFSIQYVADAQSSGDMVSRVGSLELKGRRVIETPGFLAITSRGVVPHLTPDVLAQYASFGGVHLALEDCRSPRVQMW
jgi:queuine tRNA-ribosyltransferase subunit QTRTD1